jgi:hypothetical protein
MSRVRLLTALSPLLASCFLLPLAGCGSSVASTTATQPETTAVHTTNESALSAPVGPSQALAARQKAAEEGKYLFAFFTKTEKDNPTEMRSVFDKATAKVTDRANVVAVSVTDPAEKEIVEEYGLARAPMPLVLAIAPNGAITGGFPTSFSEQDILSAFATPVTERCMKSLQDGKLVFLCVQNGQTKMNDEAMQGVKSFAADERFRDATEIVTLDPTKQVEQPFLRDLQIDGATKTATTVFLAPPGAPIAIYEGMTTKDQLLAELQKAGSCGPGGVCGPGGCAPPQ